ncbi:molybdenum cofactor guanylyltransferase MobA [Hoeflea sp. TYP-13]|uniref:molybdenum cofactor guanylyltransferase MobA n=1 Tax=Hoeflea sp. TYP-13 TaxID=3230023 RepID=UPI0034C6AAA6
MNPKPDNLIGCVLAGGLSRRMGGGDKALRLLGGVPMLGRVIERLRPQTGRLIVNANGDPQRFSEFGLPVVEDDIKGFAGPLAGVAAGMRWSSENAAGCSHIVTAAADTPFFPADLVSRFLSEASIGPDTIVMATSQGNRHPVFALWPVALHDDLARWLQETETYKVMAWVQNHDLQQVDFPLVVTSGKQLDPFFNANTPEDFATAEKLAMQMSEETLTEGQS